MGSPRISVVAVIDLDGRHVRLVVTGRLTVNTQSPLYPLIRRARALTPFTRVVVDLTGAQIAEEAAVEALTRHTGQEHTGHPTRAVRFALSAALPIADAEDLRRLRAEQHSWAASSTNEDGHSTGRHLTIVPPHPQATSVTATVRHRISKASLRHGAAEEYDHAAARATPPTTSSPHITTAAEPTTGTVLPFRPPQHLVAPPAPRSSPRDRQTTANR